HVEPRRRNRPLLGPAGEPTMQTHLCLLPNQFRTYVGYVFCCLVSLSLIGIRAFFVSFLELPAFAHSLNPAAPGAGGPGFASHSSSGTASYLPLYKTKEKSDDDDPHHHSNHRNGNAYPSRRYLVLLEVEAQGCRPAQPFRRVFDPLGLGRHRGPKQLRIRIDDDFYDGGKSRSLWRAASGRRRTIEPKVVLVEFAAMAWRVGWVAVLLWVVLNRRG
ncbi:unnamed protein product, partial [Parascedosporium putredinis]